MHIISEAGGTSFQVAYAVAPCVRETLGAGPEKVLFAPLAGTRLARAKRLLTRGV